MPVPMRQVVANALCEIEPWKACQCMYIDAGSYATGSCKCIVWLYLGMRANACIWMRMSMCKCKAPWLIKLHAFAMMIRALKRFLIRGHAGFNTYLQPNGRKKFVWMLFCESQTENKETMHDYMTMCIHTFSVWTSYCRFFMPFFDCNLQQLHFLGFVL